MGASARWRHWSYSLRRCVGLGRGDGRQHSPRACTSLSRRGAGLISREPFFGLLAHRAVNPPPSSSLAEERTPLLTSPPYVGARFPTLLSSAASSCSRRGGPPVIVPVHSPCSARAGVVGSESPVPHDRGRVYLARRCR